MPAPILSGVTVSGGFITDFQKSRPNRVKGRLIGRRVVKTGYEARGGALTRPTSGQMYPRGVTGRNL